MSRFLKTVFYLVMVVTLVAACTPTEPATTQPQAQVIKETVIVEGTPQVIEVTAAPETVDKYGGTFTLGIEDEPPGFNPIQNDNWYEIWIYSFSNEPLTWGGENYGSEWIPTLAESWDRSEDGKEWTIHLRPNVTWQDGEPFTADDVVFWATAIQDPDTEMADWCRSRFYLGDIPHKFEKIDDLTVKVTTAEPVPNLIGDISVPLIPEHYFVNNNISNAEMLKSKFNTDNELLGTGPFRITEYRRGEAVILEKNKNYWRGEPYLDSTVFRIVPDKQSLIVALQTGEVDYANVSPQDVPQLLGSENLEIKVFDSDGVYHFRLNTKKPQLKDKRARQALMYALDRSAFVQTLELGYGKVAESTFTPYVTAYQPLPAYDYNPDKAKQLLEEVGWKMGPNGVYVAENVEGVAPGTPFTMVIDITSESKTQPSLLAQQYWKAIGIDATLRQIDRNVWMDENNAKADKKYDAYWTSIGSAGSNGTNYNWLMAAENEIDPITSYSNPEVVELFRKAKASEDPKVRDEYLHQAALIVWDELPFLNVYTNQSIYVVNKRVHLEDSPIDPTAWVMFHNLEKIWVEK